MIKRILNWFGYIPKLDFDIIVKLNADLANRIVEQDKFIDAANAALELNKHTISKLSTKIKKLNQNNIRLLKKQGEFKEQIKALEEKLNVYERQSKH